MNMFEEVAGLVPKTRLTTLYVEYRPWLKDKTHHYRAVIRYYPRGKATNSWGYKQEMWVIGMSDDPHDAIHKMEAELMLRKDR